MAKPDKEDIIEEWKPETILGSIVPISKAPEFGLTQEQLIPGIHYPGTGGSGSYFSGTASYTTTGTKTISGAGMTPKMIRIGAVIAGTNKGFSDSVTSTSSVCRYVYDSGGNMVTGIAGTYSVYLQVGGNATRATTITPTSDGFTMNVIDVSAGAFDIIYELYG